MSTADSPSRATSQKDDQEELSAVESGDEFEASHLIDEDGASNRGGPSRRRSKRARKATSKSKAPRKKYVKGKQGALQGIMKMPIEVFTEIAYHITPVDLITLIRTNKFFRAMLLRRSSILIWQHARANIPELPPCPTGMSEPQYAALMFSKCCTLCGVSAPAKADPWLRVRLCASCRETKLRETTWGNEAAYGFVATSFRIKLTKQFRRRTHMAPTYCLQGDFEQVNRLRQEFQQRGDHSGLREWERVRHQRLLTQNEEAGQLLKYIDSVAESRAHELEDLKVERREQVHQRLKALGWDEMYFDFWGGDSRGWNSLVDVPKPLTERIWTNLLPKLTPLLEENRSRVDDREKRHRQLDRLEKVQRLMCQFKRNTHPYQAIVDALGLTVPAIGASYNLREVLHVPFPRIYTAVSWDFMKDIYEEENSLERVEELFDERREQLDAKVLTWREEIEKQLVGQYVGDGDGAEPGKFDPIVLVQGSTEATKHLSPSARFLLRADTVFKRHWPLDDWSPEDLEYDADIGADHFPSMISTFTDDATSYIGDLTDLARLGKFVRHTDVEKLVKILLKDMGMPDVAHIELRSKKDAFACGRCHRIQPITWADLLNHYHTQGRLWVAGKYKCYTYSTRHPIIIRNMHDLQSESNTKPLVLMLSDDDHKVAKNSSLTKEGWVWCLICNGVGLDLIGACSSLELMQEHMHEMHDITGELVQGLHYTGDHDSLWMQYVRIDQWQKDWDAYYDARQKGDAIESEPQAGSSGATETASD